MIKLYVSFFTIIFCCQAVICQARLSETEKFATTAKIWGFLKYYHPEVADGRFNWDEQLFKVLPKVKGSTTKEQLSQIYLDWIDSLGEVKPCKKCYSKKGNQYFDKNFNLSWVDNDQLFTTKLSEKLKYIEQNRHQGKKYYVDYYSRKLKIANFTNENDYKDFDWQDENLRLLALFRYWNMVEYFFPYKYQIDTNWDDVLNKVIPKFSYPKSETDFHLAMVELAVSIDDSHVRLNTEKTYLYFGHYYLPIQFKLISGKAVITEYYNDSLARLNDLKIGDVITKADDKKIETILQEEEKYIMGSNIARKKFNASYYILNGPTDSLKLEILRDDQTLTKPVKRYLYRDFKYKRGGNEKPGHEVLKGNIGYINVAGLKDFKVKDIMEDLKDTKAIIFDTRKTPAALIYSFTQYFTSPRKSYFKVILPNLDYPGKFLWEEGNDVGNNKKLLYKGEVILMVDEGCQSQCEFTVMCLQTGNNTTTIGTQTSGADGNVSIFNMVGGFKTRFTGVGIFYPDGTETQRKGVEIDIEVKPTIRGVVEGRDEILERAIEFANQ